MKVVILYGYFAIFAAFALGGQFELESGEIITDENPVFVPRIDNPVVESTEATGIISPRDLFGRQACYAPRSDCGNGCCSAGLRCCENVGCADPVTYTCCQGGTFCYAGQVCCKNRKCCGAGGKCCTGGGCCYGGLSCAIYDNGLRVCYDFNARTSSAVAPAVTTEIEPPTVTSFLALTTTPATTTPPAPPPSTRKSCANAGYKLCPDNRFCCSSGSWCFYDSQSQPRCWDGSSYYTYYYYYSWSYSFGVLWYTTSTEYSLDANSVASVTVPPPPDTPSPTSLAVPPPSDTGNPQQVFTTTTANPGIGLPAGSSATTPTIVRGTTSISLPTSKRASSASTSIVIGSGSSGGGLISRCGSLIMSLTKLLPMLVISVIASVVLLP